MSAAVAVVGAGVAGIGAARELAARGVAVVLFDRGQHPGGRCGSRDTAAGSFDHGAPCFTADAPSFRRVVEALAATGRVAAWQPRAVSVVDGSVTPAATERRYVGQPSMRAFVDALSAGLDITSATRIAVAEPCGRGWALADDAGFALGEYDALVLAMPREQARALVPAASPLRAACRDAASEVRWVALLGFDAPLPLDFDDARFAHPTLARAVRESAKPGRHAGERWLVEATDTWSTARRDAAPDAVAGNLANAFQAALGLEPLAPHLARAHRWGLARPHPAASCGVLADAEHKLVLCGDWSVAGGVEGAFLAGIEAAAATRKLLGTIRPPRPRRARPAAVP